MSRANRHDMGEQLSNVMGVTNRQNSQHIVHLPWNRIIPRDQSRETFENIEELANSIQQHGQLQPIRIIKAPADSEADYQIVMGERRWRACRMLDIPVYAVISESESSNEREITTYELIENLQRENLTPFEMAKGFLRLSETGMTYKEIGASISKSESYIAKYMRLAHSPVEIRELFKQSSTKDPDAYRALIQLWEIDQAMANEFIAAMGEQKSFSRKEVQRVLNNVKRRIKGNTEPTQLPATSVTREKRHHIPSTPNTRGEEAFNEYQTEGRKDVTGESMANDSASPHDVVESSEGMAFTSTIPFGFKVSFPTDEPSSYIMGTMLPIPGPEDHLVYVVDAHGQTHIVACESLSVHAWTQS